MTTLTREALIDGSYLGTLAMPAAIAWSEAELERSLDAMLEVRPSGALWIFGYGSLIWKPLIAFDAHETATLEGWHRSFCIRSIAARGTVAQPGRMLALESGGQVQGVAFRVPEARAVAELRLLWAREMCSGVYRPLWTPVTLAGGEAVAAITFVANPLQALYEADATVQTVARIAARAAGVWGPNADYIHALDKALTERGLEDPYVKAIVHGLKPPCTA